jgi:hypothetical protein
MSNAAGHRVNRIPPGHPEGYLEAFATIDTEAATAIAARRTGFLADPALTFPTIEDGFGGVAVVDAGLRLSAGGGFGCQLNCAPPLQAAAVTTAFGSLGTRSDADAEPKASWPKRDRG